LKGAIDMEETPLETVKGWSPEHISRMKGAWITTAEQVVALGATSNGVQSLSEQLNVPTGEASRLLELARSALSAEARAEMEAPVDTSNYGLGVTRPPKTEDTR
jgi:hypothetical protein